MDGRDILVDRYELRDVLGRGGMAEVRDGWDTRLCRPVAIKLLHPALSTQDDHRRRFVVEARSAAALEHPNIVAVHDFGEHDDTPFIVMERLPAHTLADIMAAGPMPVPQVRSMLDDVLSALSAAHRAGVLHRDVKPGNILLSATGDRLKVGDFGIAKTAGAAATMTGQIIGTMAYMSPERVCGAPASVADDLYAVGVMGYEAVLGIRAFPHDNPAALAHAVIDNPPPPLRMCRPDLDPVLAGVIDHAMSRAPEQRFTSADQMRAALAGDRAAMAPPAPRPVTRVMPAPVPPSSAYVPAAQRRRRRGPGFWVALAGIGAAFLLAAIVLAADPFSEPAPPAPVSTGTTVPPTTTPPTTTSAEPVAPAIVEPGPALAGPGGGPGGGPGEKPGGPGGPGKGHGRGGPG